MELVKCDWREKSVKKECGKIIIIFKNERWGQVHQVGHV